MGHVNPLRPELREAAETLEQALAEACTNQSVREADTGELIRIEEMLELAGEAARRAISLRRKARHDAEASGALGSMDDTVADQAPEPGHRLFVDAQSVKWDVWAVYPEARPSSATSLPGTFQSGWLVFECATEKRRLSPIPNDWQSVSVAELEQLSQRAEAAPKRSRSQRSLGDDAPPR